MSQEHSPEPTPEPTSGSLQEKSPQAVSSNHPDGPLLALLSAAFYSLFTLLPGSNSNAVLWPWVFLWQWALALPLLWLLWQLWFKPLRRFALGNGLDWLSALMGLGLVVSTVAAEFPHQARWYAWAAFCGLAALYALKGWLTPQRAGGLLRFQGFLALAFIVLSLVLWVSQIYLPELGRIQALEQYGVKIAFSFNSTSLRNWHPIGHQNYVAGYLDLVLPLLGGLALVSRGWQRWLWVGGLGLGFVDLYTTSSRGGWLGLVGMGVGGFVLALVFSPLPRRVLLPAGLGLLAVLGLGILANNRLRQLTFSLVQGDFGEGELAYRLITNVLGWRMGSSDPLTGVGLGSVPLVYQRFRPFWAGREAEIQYQLHSTPAQLWGEMGLWGIWVPLVLTGWLGFLAIRWARQAAQGSPGASAPVLSPVLVWSLLGGLFAYGLMSLTDYQLDNLCISGAIAIYLAVLALVFQGRSQWDSIQAIPGDRAHRWLAGLGLGVFAAMGLWLIPIHRAWALSSQGFAALPTGDFDRFAQRLEQAHTLAPWEPYYPYQLGWNLGNFSYQIDEQNPLWERVRADAVRWFETANGVSPDSEFGFSNLGWLQSRRDPPAATAAFSRSAQLMAAKPGVFFGLGVSRLRAGDRDRAIAAMELELLRNPMILTSPLWRISEFARIYDDTLAALETRYGELLTAIPEHSDLAAHWHQVRGGLRWWQGDLAGAGADWAISGTAISRAVLALAQGQAIDPATLPDKPGKYALMAWLNPSDRRSWLEKAWVTQPDDIPQLDTTLPPPETLQELTDTLNTSDTLDDWLKVNAPSWQPRSQRLGFGVISRHIDGPIPSDFYPRVENIPMVEFFSELLPSPIYFPDLDIALQPLREDLLKQVQSS